MIRRLIGAWAGAIAVALTAQVTAAQDTAVDVTGAWTVAITLPSGGKANGLAILSQDGATITGMIGPGETEMMPAYGTVEGDKVTLETRPRTGRTAAFARCELTATAGTMTGTIDTDKGDITFARKPRPTPPPR